MVRWWSGVAWCVVVLGGCAAAQRPTHPLAPLQLSAADGSTQRVPSERAELTVVEFFSADCDCQRAHDARLNELAQRYEARGVAWFAVDSETDASSARDAALAKERGYLFALLVDHGAALAQALGAEYATYSVVLGRDGRVLYRGGIDSDQRELHDDARFYLRDALDDLLAHRPVRQPQGPALGCALRVW